MSRLDEVVAAIERPDEQARTAARDRLGTLEPTDKLGALSLWWAGVRGPAEPEPPAQVRLVVVSTEGVPERTRVLAESAAVAVRVVDPGVVEDAVERGIALADQEADSGVDLLAVALPDPDVAVPAAVVVGLLTGSDPATVTPPLDDAAWMRTCAQVRDSMRRVRPLMGDHRGLLKTLGSPALAMATGLLVGAAARRTPILLDGPATAAAALVAHRVAFRAANWWLATNRSPHPAHDLALARLSLDPLLDLGHLGDDGIGALLAVPILRAAVALAVADPF